MHTDNSYRSAASTRPDSTSCEARIRALRARLSDVRKWAIATENASTVFAESSAFENLIAEALLFAPDAYAACRNLEETARWDIDVDLVLILNEVYRDIPAVVESLEREWVIETGTRFPAGPGAQVKVVLGKLPYLGKVADVNRATASGLIHLHLMESKSGIWVDAEDIVEVLT